MRIRVRVTPHAKQTHFALSPQGTLLDAPVPEYRAWVPAPPEDNKANEAVIRLIAQHFSVAPSTIRLVSGHTFREKVFEF